MSNYLFGSESDDETATITAAECETTLLRTVVLADGIRATHVDVATRNGALENGLFRKYRMKRPLVICAKASEWPAKCKWVQDSLPCLSRYIIDAKVDIMKAKDGRNFLKLDYAESLETTLLSALECTLEAAPGQELRYSRFYLDSQPQLEPDIDISFMTSLVNSSQSEVTQVFATKNIGIWSSSAGCVTPLHYDLCHGFLAQCYGRKRFILASHEDFPLLYVNRDCASSNKNVSRADLSAWLEGDPLQRSAFPYLADVTWLIADLAHGDILYTPPGWFHHVTSVDNSLSVLLPFDPAPHEPLPPHISY